MTPTNCAPQKRGTLLVLSTYPIRRPRHGGQLRSSALMIEYEKTFSKVVRTAVFNSSVYTDKEFDRTDIPSPIDITQEIVRTPELEAWILGNSPVTSSQVREQLTKMLERLKPEAIVFEQPFLYPGMKVLLSTLNLNIPLIYSSHNVESDMMKEIFTNQKLNIQFDKELNQLQADEKELSQRAMATVAVSDEDASVFRSWGAKNVLIQGNGATKIKSSRLKRLRVRRIMKKLGVSSYALYVGSSHLPNIEGFIELLGTRLGYLPPDTMIFLAGDIARGLQPEVEKFDPVWGKLMWARIFNWDRVSEKTLSALIEEASCVLLPIISGGGSNLKTAEALLAGKPIVATSKALRGFTKFEFSDLLSARKDTSEEFKAEITKLLVSKQTDNSGKLKSVEIVRWEYQLSMLSNWLLITSGSKK